MMFNRNDQGDYEASPSGCHMLMRLYKRDEDNTLVVNIGSQNSVMFGIERQTGSEFNVRPLNHEKPTLLMTALSLVMLYKDGIDEGMSRASMDETCIRKGNMPFKW